MVRKTLKRVAHDELGNVFGRTETQHGSFNPLRPNINIQILHSVLYTFPGVLTRRICSWGSYTIQRITMET